MRPNPALRKLGFADDDRVAIIHADDIGMCQASLTAFAELLDFGLVSCGAAMTPCPWFPSVAAYAAAHPNADIGVHLTLNCEYSTYRWGPLSTRDPASSASSSSSSAAHSFPSMKTRPDRPLKAATTWPWWPTRRATLSLMSWVAWRNTERGK